MISPSKSHTDKQGRGLLSPFTSQQGAFSPFMFGLIMGVTIFSAVSMQYAKQRLAHLQEEKTQRARAQAQDLASAMDFAILSETKETYQDDYSLERARKYATTTGKTEGNQDFQVNSYENGPGNFGNDGEKITIAATDDSILRNQVNRSGGGQELDKLSMNKNAPVAVYNTSQARDRQIRTSNSNMENLAEQVYAFYAAKLKFPTTEEFETLESHLGLHDAWGDKFDYAPSADLQSARLSFTTPWNYTRNLNLSLKDGPESSK